MHGQEGRTKSCNALDTARHGIADVMQLEIDENLLAGVRKLTHQRQSSRIGNLIADLVKRHAVAEPRNHRFRRLDAGQVEPYN